MQSWCTVLDEFPNPFAVPTRSEPNPLSLSPTPRVILFDIYGTLISPHPNDLDEEARRQRMRTSFVKTALRFGFSEETGHRWRRAFFERVAQEYQVCRRIGITKGEILIEQVWESLILEAGGDPEILHPKQVAAHHEMVANPVAAFSGVQDTLTQLANKGICLGLASNCQFYTLPILERCLGSSIASLFDADWVFLSYRLGFSKPEPHFFRLARITAQRKGLRPEEVLMVGNDLELDVQAARLHGLQAVLFDAFEENTGSSLPEEQQLPVIANYESLLASLE